MSALKDRKKSVDQHPARAKRRPASIRAEPYERRMVTILFADIVSYTTISEQFDPEYMLEIMSKAYPCLLDPVFERGGSIIQVLGDGVLAFFGTPSSREDDPERAILAGLDIVHRIKLYSKVLRRKKILNEFRVRVGINTGLVVVGDLEPKTHLDIFAMGDAVNLAARMQQNAPPNGVMISRATYQHVYGLFDVQAQTPMRVKGRRQIEQSYLIQKAKPAQLRRHRHGNEGMKTPMLGRASELALLQSNYKDALQEDKNPFIIISGDAGIGKTRLMEEFAGWVAGQLDPPVIFHGHANPNTSNVPYAIFRDLFAHQFDILESDSRSVALEKFRLGTSQYLESEKADLVGQLVGFNFGNSPSVTRLLGSPSFSEMATLYLLIFFRKLAARPVMLLLEDISWIDDSSFSLLHRLFEDLIRENRAGFMVVCTTRIQFFERFPTWKQQFPNATSLELPLLSQLCSRAFISEILKRVEDIPEDLFGCIVNKTEGNPLFIEETIKMLIEEGVINTEGDSWQVKKEQLAIVHVPPTLTGILQTRLDGLPAGEQLVLQCAAVVGQIFWDGLLNEMVGNLKDDVKLEDCLVALRTKGLILYQNHSTVADNHEYKFKHALFRDTAYENVLIKHRRVYHGQVATWIEQNAGERLDEHLASIAGHYASSNQPDRAADWYIRAGERAVTQSSFSEALQLFDLAIKYIHPDDISRMWQAILGHDEAVGILGNLEKRRADDSALLNMAVKMGDDSWLAEAYYRLGSQENNEGNYSASMEALVSALQAAQRIDDQSLQALILPLQVHILFINGDLQSAASLVDKALQIAYQTENADIIVRALTNLSIYYLEVGDISRSVELMQQQVEMNRQQGNHLGEAFGLINLGYAFLSVGQFEQGNELLELSLQAARDMGASSLEAYSLLNLGLAQFRLGRFQGAYRTIELSLPILEKLSDQRGLASARFYLGLVQENAGNLSEATLQYEMARDAFLKLGGSTQVVEAQAGLARMALIRNDLAEAEDHSKQIKDYLGQNGTKGLELPILVYISCARVYRALENQLQLQAILEEGKQELNQRLEKITDMSWRETFLKGVPENNELMNFSISRMRK